MSQKVSLVLSATSLVLVVFATTPLGAVAQSVLPRNSVGPAQLKRNAVTARDLAPNAVRGGHVLDGSLLAADFKPGQLPQGPKGDKGDKGDKGANGISRVFTTSHGSPTTPLTASSTPILSLPLQAGRYLLVGKVWVSGVQSNFTAICTTGVGATGDVGIAGTYNGAAGVFVSDTIAMQTVVDLPAATTATISCFTPRAGNWAEATLSAIQVG
jgi:hypothetical protein